MNHVLFVIRPAGQAKLVIIKFSIVFNMSSEDNTAQQYELLIQFLSEASWAAFIPQNGWNQGYTAIVMR